jgi:hypothetical protein
MVVESRVLEAETQHSDDPMAYVPDTDWTILMQRKSVIICASIRAGKRKRRCVYCYPTAVPGGIGHPVPCDTCYPASKSLLTGLLCRPRRRHYTSCTRSIVCLRKFFVQVSVDVVYDLIIFDESPPLYQSYSPQSRASIQATIASVLDKNLTAIPIPIPVRL